MSLVPLPPPYDAHPGVEAWRGVAALMVVYAHYWAFSGQDWPLLRLGFTGVDLFFVLSGFVFAPYLAGKPLSVRSFAVRRFFRIYPAFVVALGLYALIKWQQGHELLYLAQHLTFTHLQSTKMAFYYNPPFWSLPAEVEFYLVLPLLAWLLCRRGAGVGTVADGRSAALGHSGFWWLLLLAWLLRLWVGFMSDRASENRFFILNYHLPGLLLEFLLGVLAWRLSRMAWVRAWRWPLMAMGLGGWLALAQLFARWGDAGIDASWLRGQLSWMAAWCFMWLVAGSLSSPPVTDRWSQALAQGRLMLLQGLGQWAGRLSYGVYLFHMAALHWVSSWQAALHNWPLGHQGVALVLTLGMAWLSLRLVEDPLRLWGRRLAQRWER